MSITELFKGHEEVIVAAILGAVGILGSALASSLPKHLLITQILARIFADPRNVSGKVAVADKEDELRARIRAEVEAELRAEREEK